MNEIKAEQTVNYFAERMAHFKSLAQRLSDDHREDEAVFAKVQMNVYDIFNTIFSVAGKTAGQEDEKVVQFFLTKLHQIPQSWYTALEKAQLHGLTEKAHIEQIKLAAVSEIKAEFERIWEVST